MPDIPVWNKCNNRCAMCANTESFARNTSGDYLFLRQAGRLERYLSGSAAYKKNAATAGAWNLTGGEPTLNPDFLKVITHFRRRLKGEELLLLSNGRRFADPVFAAAFAAAARPPFTLAVSVHGPTAAEHDRVAGVKGAFAETMRGLKNLSVLRYAPLLEIRVVLHKLNYRRVGAILGLLGRLPLRFRLAVMHYELEGRAARDRGRLAVKLSATAAQLGRFGARLAAFPGTRLYHFPLCLLPAGLRRLAVVSLPPEDRVYPPVCASCASRNRCVGLMKPYLRRFGASEIRAL